MNGRAAWIVTGIALLACGGGSGGTGPGEPLNIAGTWSGTVLRETDTCPAGRSGLITPVGVPTQTVVVITQSGSTVTVVWDVEAQLLTGTVNGNGSFSAFAPNTDPIFLTFNGSVAGNRLTAVSIHSAIVNDGTNNFISCGGRLTFDLTRQ